MPDPSLREVWLEESHMFKVFDRGVKTWLIIRAFSGKNVFSKRLILKHAKIFLFFIELHLDEVFTVLQVAQCNIFLLMQDKTQEEHGKKKSKAG